MRKLCLIVLLCVVAATGCIKKGALNLNKVVVDNWQPDWALPILKSTLTLKDMVKTSTTITTDANGLYSLHYDGKIFTAKASDYIHIPNQSYTTPAVTLSIPQTSPSFTGSISDSFGSHFTYTDTSGAQLAHIAFKSGAMHINITASFRQNITVQMIFPNITKAGTPLQLTANIVYPSGTASVDGDVSGYTADLTNGGSTHNYMVYEMRYTLTGTGQPLSPGDDLSASVSMNNLQYSFIDGVLGHYNIHIPSDTINVAVFNNTLTADIFLRNPKIHLAFTNSFGMGVTTTFDSLYGLTNKGAYVHMTLPATSVNGATSLGQTVLTNVTIDSTNSTIQNLFNPAPNEVIYNGNISLNPAGMTYNFVTDTSTISLSADAELPAWFKILDFALQDTQKLVLPMDSSILQTAEFKMLMDNSFAVYGGVQLYFADSNYVVLDSLIPPATDIIPAAPVDANGVVNGSNSLISTFNLTHDRYNAMAAKVRNVFIKGQLKTSGTSTIQIHSSDHLAVKLAFRFTLNVSSQNL